MSSNKYLKMWNLLHESLTSEAENQYNDIRPELGLFAAIIVDAAKDRDYKYFKSDEFYSHCKLLRINFVKIGYMIKQAYEIEDSGRPFPELDNYDCYGYSLYETDEDYE